MWKEFKAFAFKGNVIDLAVGVMIGGAFGEDCFFPGCGYLYAASFADHRKD